MSTIESLNQNQRERLFYIEFRLYFLGDLGRIDLVDRFGIKEAAATRDIAKYKELAPNNIEYNTIHKIYQIGSAFTPLFEYQSNQVLSAIAHGLGDSSIGKTQPMILCESPIVLNEPNVNVISIISRAIHNHKIIQINYCSHTSGTSSREIAPFALIDNGLRWHLRCFDRKRQRFTDLVLTRITNPSITNKEVNDHEKPSQDIQWNRIVELKIVPHPKLDHPKTTSLDYNMTNESLLIKVRAAVAGYVIQRWNVDCSQKHTGDSKIHHLWLKNYPALYGVDNMSSAPGHTPFQDD